MNYFFLALNHFLREPSHTAHLSVHICSVQVDLSSVLVDQVTHISDVLFKHSIGGWVRNHDCCQVLLVFIHLKDKKGQRETMRGNVSFSANPSLFILKD